MSNGRIEQEGVSRHVLGGHDDVREAGAGRDVCFRQGALPWDPAIAGLAECPVIDRALLRKWLRDQLGCILCTTQVGHDIRDLEPYRNS